MAEPAELVPASTSAGNVPRIAVLSFGVLAGSILASQIVLSRLFAATVGYYFGFMIVSLVMVGLGGGALLVQRMPQLFAPERVLRQAAIGSALTGVMAFAGTIAALLMYPQILAVEQQENNAMVLAAMFWCFFPTYFSGGVVISSMLVHARQNFYRLYTVDLLGAAAGAVLAVFALETMSPSQVALGALSVLPVLSAAGFALAARRTRLAAGTTALALGVMLAANSALSFEPFLNPSHINRIRWKPLLSEWNSFSNVSIYKGRFFTWAMSNTYQGRPHAMLDLMIDGMGGTQIVRFDGKPESLKEYDYLTYDLTQLMHELVPAQGRQLIIGPGGGVDILQAYRHGRRDITAVDINGLVADVVNDRLAEFSGRPYHLPGVKVEIENGRTFIKRSAERWDLVTLTWVDSGGSRTAMTLNEDYLYTVESYREFIDHLAPSGYLGFMRALGIGMDNAMDSARGTALAMESLRQSGVADPKRHLIAALADSRFFFHRPMVIVLVKKTPITAAEVAKARDFLARMEFTPIWLPDGSVAREAVPDPYAVRSRLIWDVVTTSDPATLYREATIDVEPPTDDRPFFFIQRAGVNRESNIVMDRLLHALFVLGALVIPFLLLPLIPVLRSQRDFGRVTGLSMAYYSALGLGFMMVEIELFHVLGLALGKPTLSLSLVLGSLLVFTGIGSLCAPRVVRGGAPALLTAFSLLVTLLALFAAFKPWLLAAIVVQTLELRIALCVAVIAPLGFCMGLPMSMGMTVLRERPDLMVWGWALNGVFSVLASVLAMYLATNIGIAVAIAIGTVCYVLAGGLLLMLYRAQGAGAAARVETPAAEHYSVQPG